MHLLEDRVVTLTPPSIVYNGAALTFNFSVCLERATDELHFDLLD